MKYNVILADPPWSYGSADMPNGSRSTDHYPSMQDAELKSLDVGSLCAEECILFMWATGPKLSFAIELGESWGFKYRQVAFIWNKDRIIPGNYTITQCEFVLVFKPRKGKLPRRTKTNVRQYFVEKPRGHSRKPEYVQDMVDLMYPNAKKLELFARRSRDGWDVQGNETTKFDTKEE